MLSIKSLRVDYDNTTAVHDLSLTLNPGDILGLVGPNGAGKTSTIKAIAGILEPTFGEIRIYGFDIQQQRFEALKRLGYMPDFSPVYENLKVWEYMDVFGAAYLMNKTLRHERSHFWLGRVDLLGKYNETIKNLSRGMRQRLVLAKTLLSEPEVLLLDEPASGMDPIARMDLRHVLKDFAALGKTVVISSHVLTELDEFCTSIAVMEKGRLIVSGNMNEIRQHLGSQQTLIIRLSNPDPQRKKHLCDALDYIGIKTTAHPTAQEVSAIFNGDTHRATEVLRKLIYEGFEVSAYRLHQENMEDIFFKIGAKETS